MAKWLFIQRALEYGGGYWFGRAYDECFWFEFEKPTSLANGIDYIMKLRAMEHRAQVFNDEFHLG